MNTAATTARRQLGTDTTVPMIVANEYDTTDEYAKPYDGHRCEHCKADHPHSVAAHNYSNNRHLSR